MAKKTLYDVIIIGSGPAGMTAAIYCARKGLNTLIIGKEVGGQVSKSAEIDNYLGFGFSTGNDLVSAFKEHVKKFDNIKHVHNILVKAIKKQGKNFSVKDAQGKTYSAKALIIASGRNPRMLAVPGEKDFRNKGISYCEVCDGPLFKGKKTAIIGSGNSGLEAALSLSKIATKVYILEYAPQIAGDMYYQKELKKMKNVKFITNVQTTEFYGDKFLKGMKYKDRKTGKIKDLKVQGVFIEIGWEPSIDFDKITKKTKHNEIIVDKQCHSSVPGIMAAGDITDVGYWQIIIAAGEGAKAALSAYEYLTSKK